MKPTWLLNYRRDVYSHDGEDGIVEKILEFIPDKNRWCVEFGAWDGIYLSNTRNLIVNNKYSAVLIEGSATKYEELKRNNQQFESVIPLCRFVGFSHDDNLDVILHSTQIPKDFDFLSVDVDGNDYHIWKAMSEYMPKLVCIEFNPTIPTFSKFVQEPDLNVTRGASLSALNDLAKEKGYELVCVTSVNAFFVKREYYRSFKLESNSPEVLRTDLSGLTYLCVGYDGAIFLEGYKKLPWHNLTIDIESLQPLPKLLRKYPHNYTKRQKIAYAWFQFFKRRSITLSSMLRKILNTIRDGR